MQVQNIECQLAQGQISRYLGGDTFSDTALAQLEEHIGECPFCKDFLEAKRAALQHMLGATAPISESDAIPGPAPKKPALIDAIRNRAHSARESLAVQLEPTTPKVNATHAVIDDRREPALNNRAYAKPLAYSAALAAVLIAMSTIMKDPTRVLGDKATTKLASNAAADLDRTVSTIAPSQPKATIAKPASDKVISADPIPMAATSQTPTTSTSTSPAANNPSVASSPRTSVAPTAPPRNRRVSTRARSNRQRPLSQTRPAPTQSGIRLYDSSGAPIN